jgi:hypothetical protein
LDLSYIKYQELPAKYELKYEMDFKNKNGYDRQQLDGNSKIFELK